MFNLVKYLFATLTLTISVAQASTSTVEVMKTPFKLDISTLIKDNKSIVVDWGDGSINSLMAHEYNKKGNFRIEVSILTEGYPYRDLKLDLEIDHPILLQDLLNTSELIASGLEGLFDYNTKSPVITGKNIELTTMTPVTLNNPSLFFQLGQDFSDSDEISITIFTPDDKLIDQNYKCFSDIEKVTRCNFEGSVIIKHLNISSAKPIGLTEIKTN